MSKTVEISRELAERVEHLLLDAFGSTQAGTELRALLAAPVVERQEPVAYADPKSFENFKNLADLGGPYAHEWMWANQAPGLAPLYTSPPAPVAVVLPEPEQLFEVIAEALGEALDCTRVWSAWGVGTMSEDDFVQVADQSERLHEIASACLDKVKELNQ